MHLPKLNDLTDIDFEALLDRMVRDGDRIVDPETGRQWPVISGGADDGGNSDDDEGEDEDDDDEDDQAARAAEAKARRTAAKAAKRELVRSLGFGNIGDLKAALEKVAGLGDESDSDEEKPKKKTEPVAVVAPDPGVLLGRIALELVTAGVLPEKAKRAAQLVQSGVEAGEAPSDDDLSDLVDELRDSEPGWFRGSDDGGETKEKAGGVPSARRPPKARTPDPAARTKAIFDERSTRKEFKLPV